MQVIDERIDTDHAENLKHRERIEWSKEQGG